MSVCSQGIPRSCLHRGYMRYGFARLQDPWKPDQVANLAVLQAVSVIFSGQFPLPGDKHELTRKKKQKKQHHNPSARLRSRSPPGVMPIGRSIARLLAKIWISGNFVLLPRFVDNPTISTTHSHTHSLIKIAMAFTPRGGAPRGRGS